MESTSLSNKSFSMIEDEQKGVYDEIMNAILSNSGGVFFLYGYGGIGKTFIWRALSACIRSKGETVLTVASSGNVALLIPGGRTAHSRFMIPIKIIEVSTCEIGVGTDLSDIGDGTIGDDNDGEAHIEIPDELLVKHNELDLKIF
ncbi:hypothetical protein V2J09_000842 [Rumex salicifolius]